MEIINKMCSNNATSFSSGDGGYDGDSIYSKKTKKQRVPKRGPGVAELEKIIREQEKKNDFDKTKNNVNEGFSFVSPLSTPYQIQSSSPILPSSNSLPKNIPFAPDPHHFSPQITTLYGNGGSNKAALGGGGGNGGKGSTYIGGSAMLLPDHALLPSMWNNSCEASNIIDVEGPRSSSSSNGLPFLRKSSNGPNHQPFPSPTNLMYRSPYSSPPSSIISFFPHSMVSSAASNGPSSVAPCNGTEPPSNQTLYHYTSLWPEDDKMVGTKRSRPFSMEISPSPYRHHVPTYSPQMNRLDSPFSCGRGTIINLEPSVAVSREMMMGSTLELKFKRCNTDYGYPDGNFLLFGAPAIPSPSTTHISQQERSNFNSSPYKESREDSSPQRQGTGGSVNKKPFYSFMLPLEQMGKVDTNISLNNEKVEARGDALDLSLRL